MRVLPPAVTSLIPMTALHSSYTQKLSATLSNSFSLQTYILIPSFTQIPFIPHLNLHLTTHACKSFSFLDVKVSLNDGIIETVFNTKTTDKHQYFLRSSCRLSLACITGAL